MGRLPSLIFIVGLIFAVLLQVAPVISANSVAVQDTRGVPASVAEPAIVTDGSNYYIAFINVSDPTHAEGDIVVVKVGSDGSILWKTTISNDIKAITVQPLIIGDKIFLGIDKWGNKRDIYYAVLDADTGKILVDPTAVAASDDYEEYVAVAYNPDADLVALAFFDSAEYGIYVQLFNATNLQPVGLPLGPYSTEGVGYKGITFNILPGHSTLGEGFLLVYNYYNGDQKDLAAIYIYSDGTTDTLAVPETPDANETVGSHFTFMNPVTFRRSTCFQVFPGGNFGYDIIVPVMAYTGRDQSVVRLLVVDANLDVKYIDIDSGGYPSLAVGRTTIGVAYRNTVKDSSGDIKFAILENIDAKPSISIISLSDAMGTWSLAEGYSKATYNDDKQVYVVSWGVREQQGDYRIIAVTIGENGMLSSNPVELYDTPGVNDYPVTLISSLSSQVGELVRIMIREVTGKTVTRYDQNLTLILMNIGQDIPLPTKSTSNMTHGTPTIITPAPTPTTTSPTTTAPTTSTTTPTTTTTTPTTTPTSTTPTSTGGATTPSGGGGGGLSTQTIVLIVIVLALVIVAIVLFMAMRR